MSAVELWRPVCACVAAMLAFPCNAAVLAPGLESELDACAPEDELQVIVTLSGRVDTRLYEVKDRRLRDTRLYRALREKSAAARSGLHVFLEQRGARAVRELWVINGIALTARTDVIRELAEQPDVENIRADEAMQAPVVSYGSRAAPQWNLNAVHAQDLWALDHTGTGVVVANMDTGVDADHPDLAGKWRGGDNSWFDPHGEHAAPFDGSGHGTQSMSIMVGGDVSGTPVGVAPGASWIAARLYNDAGQARFSDIHLAFQWLLDPDGNPATVDAPDVVNASWGLTGTAGQCITEFGDDIAALKAAGIAVVFAAGDSGAAPLTSLSPASDPQGFASGAVNETLVVAPFSSRGPSACDGGIFPRLVAPGVNISAADLSSGGLPIYTTVSGTSYAAPHTAGAMALLIGAFPDATVADLESALMRNAQDLGVAGPDSSYGYGLTDALATYQFLLAGTGGSQPTIDSAPVTKATQGTPYSYVVQASDPGGGAVTFALDAAPAGMTVDAATGEIAWTPGYAQEGIAAVTVRAASAHGQAVTQAFTVAVARSNVPPAAADDAYSMVRGGTLTVPAGGVLANDSDPNRDPLAAVLVRGAANGRLTMNADGSFNYLPQAGFTGTDSFVYRAYDGTAHSGDATVTLGVNANKPPVARNDSVLAAYRRKGAYAPAIFKLLDNDFDPDGNLNPAGIAIVSRPGKGGTVAVNADGTVSYTPRPHFRGTEVFQYQVTDNLGAYSNRANVWVNVY